MEIKIPKPMEILFSRGVSLSCGRNGTIDAEQLHGLFAGDTRVLSTYRVGIAGQPWQMLSRVRLGATAVDWSYQSPAMQGPRGELPEGAMLLTLKRRLQGALHDDLELSSFTRQSYATRLVLHMDADFADIFEVKERSFATRLNVQRAASRAGVQLLYDRRGFRRGVELRFSCSNGRPKIMGSLVVFEIDVHPKLVWNCCVEVRPILGHKSVGFAGDPHRLIEADEAASQERLPALSAPPILMNPYRCGRCDLRDLAVLKNGNLPYTAAGAPWFVTLFGRDTLWVALMTTMFESPLAAGTLAALSALQSSRFDDFRDEQPGKFPHEIRSGELAARRQIPHSPYYGTHDAPALFGLALWNAWRWTGQDGLLHDFLPAAVKGLDWCAGLGDGDQDGLLEYGTRSRAGYFNQGWKDAGDAILHADGRLPDLPIAAVELQGYWYAACLAVAEMLAHRKNEVHASRLRDTAAGLRRLVEDRFWMEGEGYYAIALDGHKRQVASIASNPGHLLWSGLPGRERARTIAGRLLAGDMFSGWGLRTLSAKHPDYNPISYQRGSVWPFDTIVCAAGLLRYGMRQQACALIRSTLEAANCFENDRLPELFGGTARSHGFPVPYPKANIPQAWSAAAPLLAVQLFLGMVPDAPNSRCYVNPYLPEWLPYLDIQGLKVGEGVVDIRLENENGVTKIQNLKAANIEVREGFPEAPLWGDISA